MKGWALAIFAAFCFGSSPILIKEGLAGLGSPLVGIMIAQIFAALACGLSLGGLRRFRRIFLIDRRSAIFWILTGVFLVMGRFFRWAALDLAPVNLVAPILGIVPLATVGFSYVFLRIERVTARLWLGAVLVVIGATLVTLSYIGIL
jgi:uncharacterized membrane protein